MPQPPHPQTRSGRSVKPSTRAKESTGEVEPLGVEVLSQKHPKPKRINENLPPAQRVQSEIGQNATGVNFKAHQASTPLPQDTLCASDWRTTALPLSFSKLSKEPAAHLAELRNPFNSVPTGRSLVSL
ncbi:hypothetical protein C8Q76DRAFT_802502 [Earliella scabrosa]|nr:hypothetical protein C8Q76DRAFT_802502 [Earliella scabrosa]